MFDSPKQMAALSLAPDHTTLVCNGPWVLATVDGLKRKFDRLSAQAKQMIALDASGITTLDTAGALLLQQIVSALPREQSINVLGLKPEQQALLELVQKKALNIATLQRAPGRPNWLFATGQWTVEKLQQCLSYFSFAGETTLALWALRRHSRDFQWRYVLSVLGNVGVESLAIVALMAFLVGIVLAYQLAMQLQIYGADIYVVEASGIAILREFSPLITAIIIAGKTSTAFAALIGTMKINQEIDALVTMGISPMQRIVLPRIIALLIALPLLTVWSSIFGILGSMVMSLVMVHISFVIFLQRFGDMVETSQYILGMIKTPVFALIIAMVGCFQGFQVGGNADSVGKKTTQAAVQAIFLIIIADAFFSVFYSWKGL